MSDNCYTLAKRTTKKGLRTERSPYNLIDYKSTIEIWQNDYFL